MTQGLCCGGCAPMLRRLCTGIFLFEYHPSQLQERLDKVVAILFDIATLGLSWKDFQFKWNSGKLRCSSRRQIGGFQGPKSFRGLKRIGKIGEFQGPKNLQIGEFQGPKFQSLPDLAHELRESKISLRSVKICSNYFLFLNNDSN